jgi:peroxiredoxin Q/BCP
MATTKGKAQATNAKTPATKKPAAAKPAKAPAAAKKQAAAKKPAKEPKLTVGAAAPAFTLPDDDGKPVSLASFAGKKIVVLYFYPKDDTPGCTRESCDFQAGLGAFAKKGAVILGVSRDGTASHQKFKKKYGLAFPLLTDADRKVHDAYGAWGEKTMYGKKVEGVIRTTVVIDRAGKLAAVFPGVKVDGHADKVLAAIDAAK